jgi:hypothetical protein
MFPSGRLEKHTDSFVRSRHNYLDQFWRHPGLNPPIVLICIISICIFKLLFCLDISYIYLVHENGKGLLAYSRGWPGKDHNCVPFPSSSDLKEKIQDLRNDFLLHNEIKMMLLVSITTDDMIRYVSIYSEV